MGGYILIWVRARAACSGPPGMPSFMIVCVSCGRLCLDQQGDHPKHALSVGDVRAHNMPCRLGTHEPPWSRWAVSAGVHLRKGLEQLLLLRLGPAPPPPFLSSTTQLACQATYSRIQEQSSSQVNSRVQGSFVVNHIISMSAFLTSMAHAWNSDRLSKKSCSLMMP